MANRLTVLLCVIAAAVAAVAAGVVAAVVAVFVAAPVVVVVGTNGGCGDVISASVVVVDADVDVYYFRWLW